MDNHRITYRTAGVSVEIEVPGDKDIGEICNAVRDRLFDLSLEEKQRQAAHAEAVFQKWNK